MNCTDIQEHLATLARYANECEVVVELGTRAGCSMQAFERSECKRIYCVDIDFQCEPSSKAVFLNKDILTLAAIPECDLLFIDSRHTYDQCVYELVTFQRYVSKYIILHDTAGHFGRKINKALGYFYKYYPEWKEKEVFTNNNGLTVLEK